MYAGLQRLVDSHGQNFINGRIKSLLPLYAPVLPVYIAGNRVTFVETEQVADLLEGHFFDVTSMGFNRLAGRLVAQSLPRNGRFQAMVDWTYGRNDFASGPTGRVIYYCNMQPSGPVIEMMEYPNLMFDTARQWYARHMEPELLTGT